MKIKRLAFLVVFVAVYAPTMGQTVEEALRKDSLESPLFYSLAPKIFHVNKMFSQNYDVRLEGTNNEELHYTNETIEAMNVMLPLLVNRKGWTLTTTGNFYNYHYDLESAEGMQAENYLVYDVGLRVIKTFKMGERTFAFGNMLDFGMIDFLSVKNLRYISMLSTRFKLKNDRSLMLGLLVLVDQEISVPVLPIISYSSWISKHRAWLFTFNFPYVETYVSKIFNKGSMLKAGTGLLNHGHYIKSIDYPFLLDKDADYKLRRLQMTLNTKFEKTIYKSIWLGSEVGYAYNYQTGVTREAEYVGLDESENPNGFYFKLGLFMRPLGRGGRM